jgi:Flp pilus assembly protein protease CpaA
VDNCERKVDEFIYGELLLSIVTLTSSDGCLFFFFLSLFLSSFLFILKLFFTRPSHSLVQANWSSQRLCSTSLPTAS